MAAIPKKIGKYKVISQLAIGGMGEIYKAEHPTLGSTVIIKCLTIKNNPEIEERFRREARIMMDLRDERIVQVYDHFMERSSYCIVMEYIDGIDLDDLIKGKRYLSNDMALLIFTEVCKALKYAHERKVIHRDIKPANILISKDGEVKLTDFGVAATMEQGQDLTRTDMTLGTPAYMSPEQISDPSKVDQRADIYSIGVLLYVMLTGQKPFESSFEAWVLAKVSRGRYILPRKVNPKIPPPIQRLIRKTMHHKMKRRYQNIEDILKKCSKLLKSYQDHGQVNSDIKRYLEGKEPAYSKGLKGRRFGLKYAITIIVLLALGVGGMIAYRNGMQYELLFPNEYGALTLETKIRKSRRALSNAYLKFTLFSRNKKSWKKVEGINFSLKEDTSASEKKFTALRSQKKYLPKGNYLLRLDLENEQYQTQFYLAPRSIQKKLFPEKDGHHIYVAMEKASPRLPLKLNCSVKNLIGNKEITDDILISIFYKNKWVPWKELEKDETFLMSFTSGKDYSFRFSGDAFFTKYANTSVDPEQTLLNLDVTLIPLPGNLFIRTEVPGLIVLLNDLPYHLESSRSTTYKILPPLNPPGQKISLPAGDYSLTIKEEKPWWKRISFFPPKLFPLRSGTLKITIHRGETLTVLGNINIADGALKLEIQ
jgi:serine/threonine protein kinase